MAKINHPNFVESVNDLLQEAQNNGIILLKADDKEWTGKSLPIDGKDLINFGTCGYLGLENHPQVIERTISYAKKYGVQFSISRSYVTSFENRKLEGFLSQIYEDKSVIVYTSTTLAHISLIPIFIGLNDGIILDQQAHISMQTASQLLSGKNIPIEMIRHSNLEMLEHKLKSLYNKCDKIWYIADGVYSMYGDLLPIEEINKLMRKYDKLHLYVDDAHGMSWYGKNGRGRLYDACTTNQRTLYVTTLAKGFGTMGGLVVFPNKDWYGKVNKHGGPLAYSHPIPPPMLGAAIASAEIHMSKELEIIQSELKDKIDFTYQKLCAANLPLMSNPDTPIFFVGTGQPHVGYSLNKKMLNDGYYVNIAMYPAVPLKNTGLRFTITNHLSVEDIGNFIECLKHNYFKTLSEENKNLIDIKKAFKLTNEQSLNSTHINSQLKLEVHSSINSVDSKVWDSIFEERGNFNTSNLNLAELTFKAGQLPENSWEFYYIIVKDENDKIVLATHFTATVLKDDIFHPVEISRKIEQLRQEEPYYLCSKTLLMGSLLSEGDHLYYDNQSIYKLEALEMLVNWLFELQAKQNYNTILLRDFEEENIDLTKFLLKHGFIKINMPNTNIISTLPISTHELYNSLNAKNRTHFRKDVVNQLDAVSFEFKDALNVEETNIFYNLYINVYSSNLAVNMFPYPKELFANLSNSPDYEFIIVKVAGNIISIGACYKAKKSYFPILIGIDYIHNVQYKVYKKVLFKVIERAIQLGCNKIHLGLTADLEKRKFGAKSIQKHAFVNIKDTFNQDIINTL